MASKAKRKWTLNGRGESEAPEAAMTIGLTQAAFAAEAVEIQRLAAPRHQQKAKIDPLTGKELKRLGIMSHFTCMSEINLEVGAGAYLNTARTERCHHSSRA